MNEKDIILNSITGNIENCFEINAINREQYIKRPISRFIGLIFGVPPLAYAKNKKEEKIYYVKHQDQEYNFYETKQGILKIKKEKHNGLW